MFNSNNNSSFGMSMWQIYITVLIVILVLCICLAYCIQRAYRNLWKKNSMKIDKAINVSNVKQPILYTTKVQPDVNELHHMIYNGDTKIKKLDTEPLGKLEYSLDYDFEKQELKVHVIQAQELLAMNKDKTSDPYVKLYILPDKKKTFQTRVQRNTVNPVFNEIFIFKNLVPGEFSGKTLVFVVYDYGRILRNVPIGEVQTPLSAVNLDKVIKETKELIPPHSEQNVENQFGDICFSLRYFRTASKLIVTIFEAKNLKKMGVRGLLDPFVELVLMENGKSIKKKKTSVKNSTLNPYYNESFTFNVDAEEMERIQLALVVSGYDRMGQSNPLGEVILDYQATGTEFLHWFDMLESFGKPVVRWHTLKDPAGISLSWKN